MGKPPEDTIQILDVSGNGSSRILLLMRGKPGTILLATDAGEKPVTIMVSVEELRTAIDRLT